MRPTSWCLGGMQQHPCDVQMAGRVKAHPLELGVYILRFSKQPYLACNSRGLGLGGPVFGPHDQGWAGAVRAEPAKELCLGPGPRDGAGRARAWAWAWAPRAAGQPRPCALYTTAAYGLWWGDQRVVVLPRVAQGLCLTGFRRVLLHGHDRARGRGGGLPPSFVLHALPALACSPCTGMGDAGERPRLLTRVAEYRKDTLYA